MFNFGRKFSSIAIEIPFQVACLRMGILCGKRLKRFSLIRSFTNWKFLKRRMKLDAVWCFEPNLALKFFIIFSVALKCEATLSNHSGWIVNDLWV